MTVQFNTQRFCHLARWTWGMGKANYIKNTISQFAVIAFMLQIPNMFCLFQLGNGDPDFAKTICVFYAFFAFVFSGGLMFYSFKDRPDAFRELHLIPASQLEKFTLRYTMSVLSQILLVVIVLLGGDVLQYVVGWIVGREPLEWIIPDITHSLGAFFQRIDTPSTIFALISVIWLHSFFLLGGNVFRSLKYGWLMTGLVLMIMGAIALVNIDIVRYLVKEQMILVMIGLVIFTVVNFILSYMLFCRRQHIGRFFNHL